MIAVPKSSDVRVVESALYFLPVKTRVPLKFGAEVLTEVICARAKVVVTDRRGRAAEGWGETPLSVQWAWPSRESYGRRCEAMQSFCAQLGEAWVRFGNQGHPLELGYDFQEQVLPGLLQQFNQTHRNGGEHMPRLGGLICCSVYDQALHDAFGQLLGRPIYQTYGAEHLNRTLDDFLRPAEGFADVFRGRHPEDFLLRHPPNELLAWHLVGGLDCLREAELNGHAPEDGYPAVLSDWIRRDGLKCLKVKLRGNDAEWDFQRLVDVAIVALGSGVDWLSADFNCTVESPAYVNEILDRLRVEFPRFFEAILYVEQPFAYEIEQHRMPVHSVASRKPLFLDESAHDWRLVRLGRELGWTGVALKTCKTQTGAILSACWAKAHGMGVMVQDLTNPMLAQIPHVLLARHVGTIMGVETNAMQFYPDASAPEEAVHPGIYRRRNGCVNLSSISGNGFGYRLKEIHRSLPPPSAQFARA